MKKLLTHSRADSGQVFVFVAVILTALVGMAALVIDVGSWYHAQRKLQTAADAAALAGAQELPLNASLAKVRAEQYAHLNYAGIPTPLVTFPDAGTIDVVAKADTPGIFAPVLSAAFDAVTVHAEAQAKVFAPRELKNVVPLAIHKDYACIVADPGCFGQKLTIDFADDDELDSTSSKYGLLDLDRIQGGGAGDMKKWLAGGYPDFLPIDTMYPPDNGNKNGGLKDGLGDHAQAGTTLLFPIFDYVTEDPDGYHVVGWAAFVIDKVVKWGGNDDSGNHVIEGHFVTYIVSDLAAGNPITDPDLSFGVKVVSLTK